MAIKKAFIFPGHRARIGMGHADPPLPPAAVALYKRADKILGRGISRLMRHGPLERLQRPANCHPAAFLASMAVFEDAVGSGIYPDVLAGYSVGDFTAVVASGALSFEDGLRILKARSEILERACQAAPGRMSLLRGLPEKTVRAICAEAARETDGVCEVAAVNSELQIVISGTSEALKRAQDKAASAEGTAADIAVPGPFHSPLMRKAGLEFAKILDMADFHAPQLAIISDSAGSGVLTSRAEIKDFLSAQIYRSINWKRKTAILRRMGISVLCELGAPIGLARLASDGIPKSLFFEVESHHAVAALAADPRMR